MVVNLFNQIFDLISSGFDVFRVYGSPSPESFTYALPFANKLGPLITIACVFTGLHLLKLLFNVVPSFVKFT